MYIYIYIKKKKKKKKKKKFKNKTIKKKKKKIKKKKKKKSIKYIIFKITPFQFMDYKFYKKFHTNINYCIKPKQIIKEQFE